MNILFFNNAEVSPLANGIQRITHVLSEGFANLKQAKCYSVYFQQNEVQPKTKFAEKLLLDKNNVYGQLSAFVQKHMIDVVICQQVIGNRRLFEEIRKACDTQKGCRLLFCLHTSPSHVFVKPNLAAERFRFMHGIQRSKSLRKIMIGLLPLPLYNYLVRKQTRREYATYVELFDRVVLLSENFIEEYCEIAGVSAREQKKIVAVPNAFSFLENLSIEQFCQKQKEVLIVSRLSDRQKRIARSLSIWREIEKRADLKEWRLRIVGTGEDELYYKYLSDKLHLQRVSFEGRQNPINYYRRASVYMMTSAYEGFPMVLVEACQMGVVPIVLNSYAAVKDVVDDGHTGVIVPDKAEALFVEKLVELMAETERRKKMSVNGLKHIEKFSVENVVQMWFELFEAFLDMKQG